LFQTPLRFICLGVVVASSAGCGRFFSAGTSAEPDAGPPLEVLFIGNSYTYVNDLPGMLQQIAARGGRPIHTAEVVQGGFQLMDHWDAGVAQARIRQGGWTHVVLQGQSEEPIYDPGDFFTYARLFSDLIADAGAQPAWFVTWARAPGDAVYDPEALGALVSPQHMQDSLTRQYDVAARAAPGSLLACAGPAFQRAIAAHPEIQLQQSDLSHPSLAGTYLAACTFYTALTGAPVPEGSAVPSGLSAVDAAALRLMAAIGSDCAGTTVRGAVWLRDARLAADEPDAGPPFDYGTVGFPLSSPFYVQNVGGEPVGLSNARGLGAAFGWSDGAGYPGGAGASATPYCGATLDAGSTCLLSVSYLAAAEGEAHLMLDVSGAYHPVVSRSLLGTSTPRALLTVSENPGYFTCTDANCSPQYLVSAGAGQSASFLLYVTNRGAQAVTAFQQGAPLTAPFAWAEGGAFPGGSGSATDPFGTAYPFCSGALDAGEACVVEVQFSPTVANMRFNGAASVAYSDALGPVAPDATRSFGASSILLPP
jgi:hypothetical protein